MHDCLRHHCAGPRCVFFLVASTPITQRKTLRGLLIHNIFGAVVSRAYSNGLTEGASTSKPRNADDAADDIHAQVTIKASRLKEYASDRWQRACQFLWVTAPLDHMWREIQIDEERGGVLQARRLTDPSDAGVLGVCVQQAYVAAYRTYIAQSAYRTICIGPALEQSCFLRRSDLRSADRTWG